MPICSVSLRLPKERILPTIEKSVFSTRHLAILRSIVEEEEIRSGPERLRPL